MEEFFMKYSYWITMALLVYFSGVVGHNLEKTIWFNRHYKGFMKTFGTVLHLKDDKVLQGCRDAKREVIFGTVMLLLLPVGYCFYKSWITGFLSVLMALELIVLFYLNRQFFVYKEMLPNDFDELKSSYNKVLNP